MLWIGSSSCPSSPEMRAICWSSLAGRRGNAARLLGTVLASSRSLVALKFDCSFHSPNFSPNTFAPYEYMNHCGTLIFVRVQREIQFDLTIGFGGPVTVLWPHHSFVCQKPTTTLDWGAGGRTCGIRKPSRNSSVFSCCPSFRAKS